MKQLTTLVVVGLLCACRTARPTTIRIVSKVQHNRVQLDGQPRWYYLPIDSTAAVGDTIAIHHDKKSTLPKIHRRPFK